EFGLLIDLFGGIKDLKERRIKVLHNFSFIEDPTRILRAIRYATKLGFIIDNDTINLMRNTIKTGLFTDSRNTRIKEEFFTILRDKTITIPALRILKSLDGFKFIHRKLKYNEETEKLIKKAERLMRRMEKEEILFERDKIVFFLLISELNDFERKEIIKRWSMKENFINKESYYSDKQNELKETEEVYSIYRILESLALEEIVYLYAKGDKETKNKIEKYLFELRKRKLHIGGRDLLRLGMKPSPEFSRILRIVRRYVIEGKLKTKKDELNFVKNLLEKGEIHVFEKTT
ncbi:MAG: CCA tRNA nucleotidyltransferase, partial [Caldisericia bacterium]|nr:CCA tRNA nucleotidyltransferase [Caldisericia bacterium]